MVERQIKPNQESLHSTTEVTHIFHAYLSPVSGNRALCWRLYVWLVLLMLDQKANHFTCD